MKALIVAALGTALVGTLGTASAQAGTIVIDFGAASTGTVTYTGANLQSSTALDLTSAAVQVTTVGSDDTTGIAIGTPVTLTPAPFTYPLGVGPQPVDLSKEWTVGGTTYTETLTEVTITRTPANSITLSFTGEVTGGAFVDVPATLILNATQAAGPGVGHAVSVGFTNAAVSTTVPEPATWAMMLIGFAGLGYVAFRQRKTKISLLSG
jgi:PEP-CTERM motif-containing protein